MNRKSRRETDKKARKLLSNDQYQDFKEKTIAECIKLEVDKTIKNFSFEFGSCFEEAMSKEKIGKERRERILRDTFLRIKAHTEELNKKGEK